MPAEDDVPVSVDEPLVMEVAASEAVFVVLAFVVEA